MVEHTPLGFWYGVTMGLCALGLAFAPLNWLMDASTYATGRLHSRMYVHYFSYPAAWLLMPGSVTLGKVTSLGQYARGKGLDLVLMAVVVAFTDYIVPAAILAAFRILGYRGPGVAEHGPWPG